MDYGGKYLKIRKAVHEAGFDEFYQAGGTNRFHKMFIVCQSNILGKLFWIGIDGGYGVQDELYIASQDIARTGPEERTTYKTQEEMVAAIQDIGWEIMAAKAAKEAVEMYDKKKRVDLSGVTVEELIGELEKLPKEAWVFCCGSRKFYLHVSKDGEMVCIDTDPLDYENDDEGGVE